ncbi:DUF418 domain-containing protein [Siphonobacter aquaeclarae]|uniref:DUF418 domain-containing protein n=1 Tax=Siphonobacter aquaeclarae TaxID=563176 RepID=A0A1G9YHX0_9BACT|nr:DUF418 domain-containing protein [Siphonobacter aquaeclarae]SDN08687.1 uncharacterized protein SAMN04488090_4946 [Siphonobacter aquaeclarae]
MSTQPVTQAERIVLLDTLRGVALLGILLMNIPVFAMPEYYEWQFDRNPSDPSYWVSAIIEIVFSGKMRALFSIIFGAGILLFTASKESDGMNPTGLFYRRMIWLTLFGLADAHLLLWGGDILYFYGLIGMIAYWFRKLPARYLVWATPLVAIAGIATDAWYAYGHQQKRLAYNEAVAIERRHQPLTPAQQAAKKEWMDLEKLFLPSNEEAAAHTATMRSTYSAIAAYLRPLTWETQSTYLLITIWDPLGLMLLGMALFKWGFLTGSLSSRTYRKTALYGYLVGLPLAAIDHFYYFGRFHSQAEIIHRLETSWFEWVDTFYEIQRISLTVAHISLIILLIRSGIAAKLWRRLAAVGQLAFTNYVMQSVICTLLFFGYGFGWYARLEYYQLYYVVVAIWIFQLIISPLWLQSFRFGPLEWVWRCLTYWKRFPIRR